MKIVLLYFSVFCLSLASAVVFKVPKNAIVPSCGVGLAGFTVLIAVNAASNNWIIAVFLASMTIAFVSEWFAKWWRAPSFIFLVPSFIPMIPGKDAYLTMLYLVRGETLTGITSAVRVFLIGMAIAMGISIVTTMFRLKQKT